MHASHSPSRCTTAAPGSASRARTSNPRFAASRASTSHLSVRLRFFCHIALLSSSRSAIECHHKLFGICLQSFPPPLPLSSLYKLVSPHRLLLGSKTLTSMTSPRSIPPPTISSCLDSLQLRRGGVGEEKPNLSAQSLHLISDPVDDPNVDEEGYGF